MTFTVPGEPIAKPRMTQRDKWKQRPCVLEYRAWADLVRARARWPSSVMRGIVRAVCYFPIPKSYGRVKEAALKGQPHRIRPDGDNVMKGLKDALFAEDGCVWDERITKYWDDGQGPRIEVTLE